MTGVGRAPTSGRRVGVATLDPGMWGSHPGSGQHPSQEVLAPGGPRRGGRVVQQSEMRGREGRDDRRRFVGRDDGRQGAARRELGDLPRRGFGPMKREGEGTAGGDVLQRLAPFRADHGVDTEAVRRREEIGGTIGIRRQEKKNPVAGAPRQERSPIGT